MDSFISFLLGNLYGLAIIAVPLYYLLKFLRSKILKLPDPALITAIIIAPLLIYGLSYDRIVFDKKVREIQKLPYLKTYEIGYWGSFLEPMTWFNNYIGFARFVTPDSPLKPNYHFNLYFRQDQKPKKGSDLGETYQDAHEVDCSKKEIYLGIVGSDGYMKLTDKKFNMSEKDYKFYCLDDWSKYKTALKNIRTKN
jgi:hypothetical protein